MSMLEVKDLDVRYGDFQAINGVSLKVEEGTIVALIGANGAGKSTIMQTICGINRPSKGSIEFMGKTPRLKPSKIAAAGLTMSPEGSHCFEKMTVQDNLLMGAYLCKSNKERLSAWIKFISSFPCWKRRRISSRPSSRRSAADACHRPGHYDGA